MLLDAEFKLLGWSKTKECSADLYTQTVDTGHLPNEYVMDLIAQDCLRKLYIQGTTVLPKGQFLDQHTVVMVMLKNEHLVLGYGMMICSQRRLRQPMIQGFQEIMGKFNTSLQKSADITYTQNKRKFCSILCCSMAALPTRRKFKNRAQELNISRSGAYTLHVLQCTGSIPSRYAIRTFCESHHLGDGFFIYDNCICVIENASSKGCSLAGKPAFLKFLSDCEALAGISAPFYHVNDVP